MLVQKCLDVITQVVTVDQFKCIGVPQFIFFKTNIIVKPLKGCSVTTPILIFLKLYEFLKIFMYLFRNLNE